MNFSHAVLFRPGLRRADEKTGHFNVIDRVKPAETGPLLVVEFVVTRIYHGADTSHDFISVHGHPQLMLTIIQCRIFRQAEYLIRMKGRHILLTVLI